MLLFPRSRPVGVKTESTACEGAVQPGGGSFLAAAHADTGIISNFDMCRLVLQSWIVHRSTGSRVVGIVRT
jgi:hypothetical protein